MGAVLILLVASLRSFAVLEPGQVAVRVNNLTGSHTTITQPGWISKIPFGIHSIYILDASPQTLLMSGGRMSDPLHVGALTVRASDGSNFHFQDTTIIFKLRGELAYQAILDSGIENGFLLWMPPYVRSILRDEFGKESTISVSNPANFGQATQRARERLNQLLSDHGIEVTQIVTPRPQFNDEYEKLIEERNSLGNQLEVIKSDLAAAATTRERKLAEVDRDQNHKIQQKRAELESSLATAVAEQANTIREVDTYRISIVAQGQAALSAAQQKAKELKGQLDADYRTRKAEIDAFQTQPVERVMERLGERLKGVTIEIQPWAEDATPTHLRLDHRGEHTP